jgi:drug/metabolite transporter (DMT)-like permease
MLPAVFTTLLFAASTLCGRRAAMLLGGVVANFARLSLATLLLSVFAHTLGHGTRGPAFLTFVLSGCIGFGIGDMALFQALPRIGSRLSSMMTLCLSAPMAALMEWAWLGIRLTPRETLCAAIILAGVGLALAPGNLALSRAQLTRGAAWGFLAAFCQAGGAVLSRQAFTMAAAAGDEVDGLSAAYQRLLGGVAVALLLMALFKGKELGQALRQEDDGLRAAWRKAWPVVGLNSLLGPSAGVACYQWALKTAPSGVVLPIVALTPVVLIPFTWRLEGERPGWRSLAGGIVAALGALLLAWR